jgi:membrane-associated phospholipid phosphatase
MFASAITRQFAVAILATAALGNLRAQDQPQPVEAQPNGSPVTEQPPQSTPVPVSPSRPMPGSIESRSMSWKLLLPNIIHDQPKMWGFPVEQLGHGKQWAPTLSFLALTAGLIAADPHIAPTFRNTTAFHGFNQVFSSTNTSIIIGAAPISILAVGLMRKDHYERNTALLAGEALADAELLDLALKYSTRRLVPTSFPPGANYSDSWWEHGGNSFPSGHTIAAFAVATVIARRYPHQKWLPYVAYGVAATIGFSRLTLSAHFPADVFVGGVLGYAVSRFVVLRQ